MNIINWAVVRRTGRFSPFRRFVLANVVVQLGHRQRLERALRLRVDLGLELLDVSIHVALAAQHHALVVEDAVTRRFGWNFCLFRSPVLNVAAEKITKGPERSFQLKSATRGDKTYQKV